MKTLRLLDTFSGIGGFSYAAERIVGGFETVAFVEREPFCQEVLQQHWPTVPIYDDITTFNPEPYSADVVCGGFPCQDISLAGKQAGIKEGTRSGLFYELMRVVRLVRPQYVVLENVSAILANGLDTVLGTLAEAGFDAEWACIPASAVGACHQRDRWWLVAYPSAPNWRQERSQGRRAEGAERLQGWQENAGGSTESPAVDAAYPKSERRREEGQLQPLQPAQWLAGGRKTSTDSNDTGMETARPKQLSARFKQCRELGETADASSQGRQGQEPAWRHAAESLCPNWGGYLSKPVLCRGDDGLSRRVDRLKALGNAVVPQVAAIPLARVRELADAQRANNPTTDPPAMQQGPMPPLPQ